MTHTIKVFLAGTLAMGSLFSARAQVAVTGMTKPQVSDLIRKVEDTEWTNLISTWRGAERTLARGLQLL